MGLEKYYSQKKQFFIQFFQFGYQRIVTDTLTLFRMKQNTQTLIIKAGKSTRTLQNNAQHKQASQTVFCFLLFLEQPHYGPFDRSRNAAKLLNRLNQQ